MTASAPIFADRQEAGRRLAEALWSREFVDPIVLALPRGGVPVAYEVGRKLSVPLDLLFVRKIGAPGHPEFGIGAVVEGSAACRQPGSKKARHSAVLLGGRGAERACGD